MFEARLALALCMAVFAAAALGQFVPGRPDYARVFAPEWISLVAPWFAASGIVRPDGSGRWPRTRRALQWVGLLLMVWAANGLPLDVLRAAGQIPLGVDWPGLVTRTLALAAAAVLAHLVLSHPAAPASARPAAWYGYAAFVLALPYPVLRTHWALGGMLGLSHPGAAGGGWAPWLLGIPWLLAAALSLLLVPTWRWMPRRLLLIAGWCATGIVSLVGPAGCWALVSALINGQGPGSKRIATWVFALFYGSWFLFAIFVGAATRSYQVRSARSADASGHAVVRAEA